MLTTYGEYRILNSKIAQLRLKFFGSRYFRNLHFIPGHHTGWKWHFMIDQFVLEPPRLRLRPLELSDASAIQAAGVREIAVYYDLSSTSLSRRRSRALRYPTVVWTRSWTLGYLHYRTEGGRMVPWPSRAARYRPQAFAGGAEFLAAC